MLYDSGWILLNNGILFNKLKYRKLGKIVCISPVGGMISGISSNEWVTVGQLPSGFYPTTYAPMTYISTSSSIVHGGMISVINGYIQIFSAYTVDAVFGDLLYILD